MIFLSRDTYIQRFGETSHGKLKVYLETIMLRHICFHLPTALINGEGGLNKRSVLDRSLHLLLRITRTLVLPCRAFFYYTFLFPLVSCIMSHIKLYRQDGVLISF